MITLGKNMSLMFECGNASLYDVKEVNPSFLSGSLKVMYLGPNRNGSFFSREAVEKALPTMKNVPIVCHWDDVAGEIGGHDVDVVADKNGVLRLKNLTEPCGVVPDHAQFRFVNEEDEDGEEHVYLVVDGVLLWKRQDVCHHIVNDLDGKVKHSMEITVKDGAFDDTGNYIIKDFNFTALCLLENCEPCFQGSELELFSATEFKTRMEEMMSELKEYMKKFDTSTEDENNNYATEGGEKVLEDKKKLVADYGIDIDSLEFSIDDFTIEELTEKLEAMKNDNDNSGKKSDEQFELSSNLFEEIRASLDAVTVTREWGESCRYYYVDSDLDMNEVYAWDCEDWLLYGFTYSMDGDKVVIDFESKKRKKYAVVDFDEGEQGSPFAGTFSSMSNKIDELKELGEKFSEVTKEMDDAKAELSELRQFREAAEQAANKALRDEVFGKFEDLDGIDAFEALKADNDSYSIEDLEEKCYAIRGRNSSVAKFSTENGHVGQVRIVIPDAGKVDSGVEPYGGVVEKYKNG